MGSPDLVVLVPSRGRPANITRLRKAVAATAELATVLHFGFDNDDPYLTDNIMAAGPCLFTTADRMHLAAWTNHLAGYHGEARYLASMGDDMVPVTPGWDRLLIREQEVIGGGFTYPDDGRRNDIPEMCVIDTRITEALGWMCEPHLTHWYVDNVWRDLGTGAGCLSYLPDVTVRHLHPNVPGGDKPDRTYNDAAESYDSDLAAYQRWRLYRMARDIRTVRGVRTPQADTVRHAGPPDRPVHLGAGLAPG